MHRIGSVRSRWYAQIALAAAIALPSAAQVNVTTGARWDTASFWSQSLGVRKRLMIRLPASYAQSPSRRYPVVYHLHGLGGDEESMWRGGLIDPILDSLAAAGQEMVAVTPDGDDGWYTTWNSLGDWPGCRRDFKPQEGRNDTVDSYCVPWLHYDDYIARDLVAFVDRTWRTDPRRERRAIAGISMGGYGALAIGLGYPEVFSVVASQSGVVSPLYITRPFAAPPVYAGIEQLSQSGRWKVLGPAFGPDTAAWWSRDPARRAKDLARSRRHLVPAIYLDIGTEDDGFIEQNRALRHELTAIGVAFTYREWPGGHNVEYWRAHIGEGIRFIAERIAPREMR